MVARVIIDQEAAPGLPPPDNGTICVVGFCSAVQGGDPLDIQNPEMVFGVGGYGPAPELAHNLSRIARTNQEGGRNVILLPITSAIAGSVSAVTQVGFGPAMTVAAVGSDPFDDADVQFKVREGGALGTATGQLSWTYAIAANGFLDRFFQDPITIPAQLPAMITGTASLATILYATRATVTGTAFLNNPALYGAGGTLANKTLNIDFDNSGVINFTFPAGGAANAEDLIDQLATAFVAAGASWQISSERKLQIFGGAGAAPDGEIDIQAGTANSVLGLTVAVTSGTDGALDGKTVELEADTGGPHIVTFVHPISASEVIIEFQALAGVGAGSYSAQQLLRLTSDTLGPSSTIEITDGDALALLGLTVSSAVGLGSIVQIAHLGIALTFAVGTYESGTTYTFQTVAPKANLAGLQERIAKLAESGKPNTRFVVAQTYDVTTSRTIADGLENTLIDLAVADDPRVWSLILGMPLDESDSVIRTVFSSFDSPYLDLSARSVGVQTSGPITPGGGATIRSQAWALANAYARNLFASDPGDHSQGACPEVLGMLNGNLFENNASTKMVSPTGISFCVLTQGAGKRIHFEGGFTAASPTGTLSTLRDTNARDAIFAAATIFVAYLDSLVNTRVDRNADGTISAKEADRIDEGGEAALQPLINNKALVAVSVAVDRENADTTEITGEARGEPPFVARSVIFRVGAGFVQESA